MLLTVLFFLMLLWWMDTFLSWPQWQDLYGNSAGAMGLLLVVAVMLMLTVRQ